MRRAHLLCVLALPWCAACASQPPPEPVTVGAAQPAATATTASAPPRAPAPPGIQCGKQRCDAATQICCGFSDQYTCAARPSPSPPAPEYAEYAYLPSTDSCMEVQVQDLSLTEIRLCDDSTDCGAAEVCCSMWIASGSTLLTCIPAAASGELACDFNEACVGASCRTVNTECAGDRCRAKGRQVDCAGTPCGGSTPVCCQRKLDGTPTCEASCEQTSEEDRAFDFECSSSRGCPAGATCQAGLFGSYCAKAVDSANAVVLCESDSDCPRALCEAWGSPNAPTCSREGRSSNMGWCHCGT
ncbi:MAG: hypothetical protein H6718_28775 [Polyangiaceae bacterium]|nr:hypothetical protein [Myxococcales bacterium]MCB9589442.1 hypothetical protein [Polyangiaceae bacterium]